MDFWAKCWLDWTGRRGWIPLRVFVRLLWLLSMDLFTKWVDRPNKYVTIIQIFMTHRNSKSYNQKRYLKERNWSQKCTSSVCFGRKKGNASHPHCNLVATDRIFGTTSISKVGLASLQMHWSSSTMTHGSAGTVIYRTGPVGKPL